VPFNFGQSEIMPRVFLTGVLHKCFWVALAVCGLSACGHTPVTRTVFDTFGKGAGVDAINLNPLYRYLKVSVHGREALLVLGYSEPSPLGPIETWYSSAGEVLKLQNGRILATVGLELDWRAIRYTDLPSWTELLKSPSARFNRERDEMPGYRFGVSESVFIYSIKPPSDIKAGGLPIEQMMWFEETVMASPKPRPSARYGVGELNGLPVVHYGEQCLATDLCIAWQTWPTPLNTSTAGRP